MANLQGRPSRSLQGFIRSLQGFSGGVNLYVFCFDPLESASKIYKLTLGGEILADISIANSDCSHGYVYNGFLYILYRIAPDTFIDKYSKELQFQENIITESAASISNVEIAIINNEIYYATLSGFPSGNLVDVFDVSGSLNRSWGTFGTSNGEFDLPQSIYNYDGELYVSDSSVTGGNKRIQVVDYNGNYIRTIGGAGTGDGQFQRVNSVAANDGELFAVDSVLLRLQVFDAVDGTFLRKWGDGTGSGDYEGTYTKVKVYGNIVYVVDSALSRIQLFTKDGVYIKTINGFDGLIRGIHIG